MLDGIGSLQWSAAGFLSHPSFPVSSYLVIGKQNKGQRPGACRRVLLVATDLSVTWIALQHGSPEPAEALTPSS